MTITTVAAKSKSLVIEICSHLGIEFRSLKNAYRVLLTRASQGMVIVVPPGDEDDATRSPEYYDSTYEYLCGIGFVEA